MMYVFKSFNPYSTWLIYSSISQDLEAMNDEAIITLRAEMFLAADLDIEENEAGKFAYHKLKLLPEVVRLMQK